MAKSPAHRLGQIIGYALEQSVVPLLQEVADSHRLYLDTIRPRAARHGRKLLGWQDDAGNNHNLDLVLERDGTEEVAGTPVAFIEVAWRRYTKHSVNKAGEIANALVPLRKTHARVRPFTGAVVAGAWTEGGLTHMRSQGIHVLYVPLLDIVTAFARQGIDVDLNEDSDAAFMQSQVDRWDRLTPRERKDIVTALTSRQPERYAAFRDSLDDHLKRQVTRVLVLPLHGASLEFDSAQEALVGLAGYPQGSTAQHPLVRVEVQLRYTNGDRIDAEFERLADAISFLEGHA